MLFNSIEFLCFFLPITLIIYFSLNKWKLSEAATAFLAIASIFFYSWWKIEYLPLILLSIVFNYVIGKILSSGRSSRKLILIFGIIANVSLLGYFKYTDFFLTNMNVFFGFDIQPLNIVLPLAISFFTFQQIAYLVDSYKKMTKEYNFINYALFVSFFPQLIAGPIVHHKEIIPQIYRIKNRIINYKNLSKGLFILSIGLFKKVVLADTLSIWTTYGFNSSLDLSFFDAWATSLSYTFQLYFDFSGYADMAIGAALLFNIKLPINFNSPYKAKSIQDFWRRWHITLSAFLRDYIYIPLGGNRKGDVRQCSNLLITFLIGGLWHGAGWTFVLWGAAHGIALVTHRLWKKLNIRINAYFAWFITFLFINTTWVLFRAENWQTAIEIIKNMFYPKSIIISEQFASILNYLNPFRNTYVFQGIKSSNIIDIYTLAMIVFCFIVCLLIQNSTERTLHNNFKYSYKNSLITALLLFFSILTGFCGTDVKSEFIYFNF